MIKEILLFSVQYTKNFLNICKIKDKILRQKESIEYILFIDQKINEISHYGNDSFKNALQIYKSYIIENLNNCSFEENEKKRDMMCQDFIEIFLGNIKKSTKEYL